MTRFRYRSRLVEALAEPSGHLQSDRRGRTAASTRSLPSKMQQTITAFVFILPFGILYTLSFTILPIFQTFYISLHRWEIMGTNISALSVFKNFERLLTRDTQFHQAFEQTILFVALTIPIIFVGLIFRAYAQPPGQGHRNLPHDFLSA